MLSKVILANLFCASKFGLGRLSYENRNTIYLTLRLCGLRGRKIIIRRFITLVFLCVVLLIKTMCGHTLFDLFVILKPRDNQGGKYQCQSSTYQAGTEKTELMTVVLIRDRLSSHLISPDHCYGN